MMSFYLLLPVQSSLALAMTLSWCGHHFMSKTSALCPPTTGESRSTLPVCKINHIIIVNIQLPYCISPQRVLQRGLGLDCLNY